MKTHYKVLLAVGLGAGAYLLYKNWENWFGPNADMGGTDFGVLNPSNWNDSN